MIRIFKTISQQSGPFDTTLNRITFKEQLDKDVAVDMSKSYVLLNVEPVDWVDPSHNAAGNTPAHIFSFGSRDQTEQYSPSSLVMHSKLDCFAKGNLEYNRNRNFYQHNLEKLTYDKQMNDSRRRDGFGYEESVDYIYNTGDRCVFGDIKWTGSTLSTNNAADVLIPLSELYSLGNEELPYTLGELTLNLELENKLPVINEINPFDGPQLVAQACDDSDTNTNPRTKVVITGPFTAATQCGISSGQKAIVYYTAGGVAKFIVEEVDTVTLSGGKCEIVFIGNVLPATTACTAISIQDWLTDNVVDLDDVGAGNDVTTTDTYDLETELPFFIGQCVTVVYPLTGTSARRRRGRRRRRRKEEEKKKTKKNVNKRWDGSSPVFASRTLFRFTFSPTISAFFVFSIVLLLYFLCHSTHRTGNHTPG